MTIINPNFENFIGQHIDDVSIFDIKPIGNDNNYSILIESDKDLYGVKYNHINLNTDDEGRIKEITIFFSETVNKKFYEKIVDYYGIPNKIEVSDNLMSESKGTTKKGRKLTKRFYTIKDGSFEDKPFNILWNKKNYQVKIVLKHEINKSEIIFRLPKKEF